MGHINGQITRRVNFLENVDDFECALLGALGFSSAFIEGQTGLSFGQISYRLHKANIKRQAYRDGETKLAGKLVKTMRQLAAPVVEHQLKELHGSSVR